MPKKTVSLLATAVVTAGACVSSAAPAFAAGPYCFGLPSEPLAYVCVTVGEPTAPNPAVVDGGSYPVAYLPAVCYGVGCTAEGPLYVKTVWVSGIWVPTVEVYWAPLDAL